MVVKSMKRATTGTKVSNHPASIPGKVKIANRPTPIEPIRRKLRYKKVTGGIFISSDGVQTKRDDILLAYPEDIPASFLSEFVCLDAVAASADPGIKVGLSPAGKNLWNVVNVLTGDILNEAPLASAAAKLFLEEGQELPKTETPVEKELKAPVVKEATAADEDEEEFDD